MAGKCSNVIYIIKVFNQNSICFAVKFKGDEDATQYIQFIEYYRENPLVLAQARKFENWFAGQVYFRRQ